MGLLHVQVGVLLAVFLSTQACKQPSCGCIVSDYTEISKHSYVYKPIRSDEYQTFLGRMSNALSAHWLAFTYIKSFPGDIEPPEELGNPICPTEQKHILGYFKNHGLTLCLVVEPHIQNIKKAECCGEDPPCGENTRCVASGFEQRKYLVYCDALYIDYDGCLIGTDELLDTRPRSFDDGDFIDGATIKRDADETHGNPTTAERSKRFWECPSNKWYFAFRHDFLSTTCTAKKCNCG
ncbi:uncharacterized protein LOC110455774 [Mizuhopecten yessoensis]|uniref:uncharacterized protein LOC110455774 n=1 Tax=Mizuhopecten yessoensis TaxID=6573 RepID=UPI000B45D8E6|nr:uncharacterized protein LOC110455774 [Mizuhopecten yessoensis]